MPKKKKKGRGSRHNGADGKLKSTSAGFVPAGMAPPPDGLSRQDFAVGTKVVRGPAWCGGRIMYGDQDGGEGSVGSVVELPPQLASKPDHRERQWVPVLWQRTNVLGTYRAGGTGHKGVFDVVPWSSGAPPGVDGGSMLDLSTAYQNRQISKDEFACGLLRSGCPRDAVQLTIDLVEAKGMAPEPKRQSAAAGDFSLGSKVYIGGLQSAAQYNGLVGTVESYDCQRGRYAIRIDGSGEHI